MEARLISPLQEVKPQELRELYHERLQQLRLNWTVCVQRLTTARRAPRI